MIELPTKWVPSPSFPRSPPKVGQPHWIGLVSFPRSGNTWLRFLLSHCLWENREIRFQSLGQFIPDWHRPSDHGALDSAPPDFPFRLVKYHGEFTRQFPKRIFLYRDGRDTLTAYYHWLKARHPTPLKTLLLGQGPHGCWSRYAHSWLEGEPQSTCFVAYENLVHEPVKSLKRVLQFLGVSRSDAVIHRAIEQSRFDRLQKLEKEHGVFDGFEPACRRAPYIRRGVVGDWVNLFDTDDTELFWKTHQRAMTRLGYGDDTGVAKPEFAILQASKPCLAPTP